MRPISSSLENCLDMADAEVWFSWSPLSGVGVISTPAWHSNHFITPRTVQQKKIRSVYKFDRSGDINPLTLIKHDATVNVRQTLDPKRGSGPPVLTPFSAPIIFLGGWGGGGLNDSLTNTYFDKKLSYPSLGNVLIHCP